MHLSFRQDFLGCSKNARHGVLHDWRSRLGTWNAWKKHGLDLTPVLSGTAPLCLQNLQGSKIFPHVHQTISNHWIGSVRIDTQRSSLISRLSCAGKRATEAEALQDAMDFARITLSRMDEKLQGRKSPSSACLSDLLD